MDISEVKDRDPDLVDALVAVWESSVRDTHLFLSEPEILDIRGYVPEAVSLVEHLIVAVDDEGSPVAFMGVQDGSIEMLFIKPQERGKGYGEALLKHLAHLAVERGCGRLEWACLDWNTPSIEFYTKGMGAVPMDEWTTYRLTGETLEQAAKAGD